MLMPQAEYCGISSISEAAADRFLQEELPRHALLEHVEGKCPQMFVAAVCLQALFETSCELLDLNNGLCAESPDS